MGEGAFNTKSFDEVSGECALKQVAAQGMGYLAVVTVINNINPRPPRDSEWVHV